MWIWSAFVSGEVTAVGGASECKAENVLEATAELDSETAAGRSAGTVSNLQHRVASGVLVQFEEMEKTEMRSEAEAESVIVRKIAWHPVSLSEHLEGCWCEQG